MVATVGSISVDLTTNAAKFSSGFKGAATTVERESGRMAKALTNIERSAGIAASGVKGFFGGIVAAAGLASLTGVIDRAREAISRFDEIATNSRAVGLRADTYQALSFAAKQANIEQDQLNSSLLIFTKNSGLAQEGTGSLFTGLARLNPELLRNIINARDQEEALKAVADALANARDETEKAAISNAVFGRSGVELSRLFDGGAASIDKFKQAAQKLGIIIPDDVLQKAGDLDDKLDALSVVINTKLDIALVKLAPSIIAVTQAFSGLLDVAAKMQDGVVPAIDAIGQAFQLLHDSIFGATEDNGGFSAIEKQLASVEQQVAEATAELAKLQDQAKQGLRVDTGFAQAKLEALQSEADDLRAKLEKKIEVNVATEKAKAALAAFRRSEIEGFSLGNAGRLPNVTGSNLGRDRGPITSTVNGVGVTEFGSNSKQILRDIADSIDDGSDETSGAVDRATDAISSADSKQAGYFGSLNDTLSSGFSSLASSLSYSVPANSGYAQGDSANSFRFSGLGSKSSWGGQRLSFSTGTPDPSRMGQALRANFMDRLNYGWQAPEGAASDVTNASATSAPTVVNITVKPIMEGTRLSSSSRAEIQQAASTGVNAALRAYNGR